MTHAQFRWKTINYMKKVPYEVHASIACVAGVETGKGKGEFGRALINAVRSFRKIQKHNGHHKMLTD